MHDCRENIPSTCRNSIPEKKEKQYAAIGDFGLHYRLLFTSPNPDSWVLHGHLGFESLKSLMMMIQCLILWSRPGHPRPGSSLDDPVTCKHPQYIAARSRP